MNYPINFSFKIIAFSSQVTITDAAGQTLGYVKKKKFKLKEDVRVFSDNTQSQELFQIQADRMIDFSARYNFTDSRTGQPLGGIKRQGLRSLWSATYDVFDGDNQVFQIKEESAFVKVADALIGELPVVGMFTGYFLNPAYLIKRNDGTLIARLAKQPAFFEGKFQLMQEAQMSQAEETRVILSVLMMMLLERARG